MDKGSLFPFSAPVSLDLSSNLHLKSQLVHILLGCLFRCQESYCSSRSKTREHQRQKPGICNKFLGLPNHGLYLLVLPRIGSVCFYKTFDRDGYAR